MAASTIDKIRQQILTQDSKFDPENKWSEGIEGASWIYNELSMFEDLAKLAGYKFKRIIASTEELEKSFETVDKIRVELEKREQWYLNAFSRFIAKGGTADEACFYIRGSMERQIALEYLS